MADSALAVLLREGAERAGEIPREEIPDALVERVRARLWERLMTPEGNGHAVVKLVYTPARHGFPMADSGEIRVSGARNGVDRSGREGSIRAKQQRVVGTGLSGFEMRNSSRWPWT